MQSICKAHANSIFRYFFNSFPHTASIAKAIAERKTGKITGYRSENINDFVIRPYTTVIRPYTNFTEKEREEEREKENQKEKVTQKEKIKEKGKEQEKEKD